MLEKSRSPIELRIKTVFHQNPQVNYIHFQLERNHGYLKFQKFFLSQLV